MSLLFLVIIYIIYTATSQTITANGDDIICSTSHSQCTVDCIDTNCNKIKIYSSSNNTIINCDSPLSCINTDLICIGNYNQCILSCTDIYSCTNSTVTCNDNSNNNAICRCEGIGCPPNESTSITNHIYNANEDKTADTETETKADNNNNYKINESVLIMFFTAFFIVVLCCFCILVIALSFIGLYFNEKKTNNSTHKISFGSSDRDHIDPLKYEKSEATHRMSYFSNKNMSYDTNISMYNNDDEKDDITEHHLNIPKQIINPQQQQIISQQQQQIINQQPQQHIIDIQQIINDEKRNQNNKSVDVNLAEQLGNQFETENKIQMQAESRSQTEIQHEGILKKRQLSKSVSNRNHQKFDSEDLYITAQTTLQHPHGKNIDINLKLNDEKDNEFHSENKIDDDDKKSMDDIGSDDECLPELDGNHFHTKPNLSIMNHSDSGKYTLDGHNRNIIINNNNNNSNINDLKLKSDDIMVENNGNGLHDINADISAQLPSSPGNPVAAADTITKHPPKKLLLHPPTINGDHRGNKNKNIDMYSGSEGNQSQTVSLNKNEIETENDEKDAKIDEEKKEDQLCIVRLGNMNGRYHSYDEEDYKKSINPLHGNNNMTGAELMPLMHGNTSITETISTFTIKSNPGSLSRTTSLNSAAAVRVAFPSESSSNNIKPNRPSYLNITNKQNKNITNYITHKNNNIKHTKKATKKHRNYYSEQFYNFTPQLVQFEPHKKSIDDMNDKTPPNSNRTDISISNVNTIGTEKPLILNNMSTDNNLDVSHKALSSSMIVTLPISPHNNMNRNSNINGNMNGHAHTSYYSNISDELPPPPPHILQLNDENVIRSRPKSSRKKKKSSSSRSKSKSRTTSHRDSIGSGNTVITKKSKSRSSRSPSSNNTYRHSSSSQDSTKDSKKKSKKHRKRSSPKSPSVNKTYRRNTTKSLKTIKTNTSTNHNPSQIVIKTKRKIRRNRHESVPRNRHESVASYSKNNIDDMDRDIKKHSNGNVARNVKINRTSKLMLKQSYDQNIEIPIKTSKSVNVPKIDMSLHGNGLNPKWSQKRIMMTPPVDIHHVPNGSKRNRSKYENRGFGDLIPSQSMFIRNIIK